MIAGVKTLLDITVDGTNWKVKLKDNKTAKLRKNSNKTICKENILIVPNGLSNFYSCVQNKAGLVVLDKVISVMKDL